MPIRPENRARYPKNWKTISLERRETFSAKPGDEYDGHALAADMIHALRASYEAEKERADRAYADCAALGWRTPKTERDHDVALSLACTEREAEKERADCAEQSEAELVQGAKDLDLQIDDLKHKLDAARAERDAIAELLRMAKGALGMIACGCIDKCEIGNAKNCVHRTARAVLAGIEAKLEKSESR